MKLEYHKWHCASLGREMELLVFGHAGARVIAFPTRCGRFFDYENMGIVEALRSHLEQGWLQLVCVDSIDHETFYCQWSHPRDRLLRHMRYESYILDEVLPLSRSINDTPFLTALGCSFGAYHAMNIALRHPSRFNRVVAMSGRYDLTRSVDGFRDLLDGHYDTDVYFNMPGHYMANVGDHRLLEDIRRLDIKLIVGEFDPFLEDNRHLSEILWQKGVWHLFRVWSGRAHGYRRWREMIGWFV
jgi:esterase/lipase superfamily enzyme